MTNGRVDGGWENGSEPVELCRRAAGVWSATVGIPEDLTPLGMVGATPRLEALDALGEAELPFMVRHIRTETVSGRLVVRLPLATDEELYGLGLQFRRVGQRGHVRFLRVNSDPVQDTGETHAPVPFYVSSAGYGVLVNSARVVTLYAGACVRRDSPNPPLLRDRGRDDLWEATPASDAVEIVVPAAGVELFFFAGPTMLGAVRRYNLYNGGGVLPPRWGLGFWHRVPYRADAAQVRDEAAEFRRRGYPCDVIGLEPGWHSASYPTSFAWGRDRFPDPAGFVGALRAEGFRVNLWENPYVSPESPVYNALEPYAGSHTVWGGLAVDYTLPAARAVLQEQHDREHVALGVSGYKLDECDGSELTDHTWMFPAHATFPSGHDGEQVRQVYGLALQRLTAELFRRRDRRTYGLVRASNAGASSLPYVLYSDLYDHRQFVRALCNAGFSGLLWCPEVRNAQTAEEWVRRLQVACFSPLMMLNAWASSQVPWSFPEVETIVRHYLDLRMRLMPYFYSAFARYHFDGTPPFRAMALEEGTLCRPPFGASGAATASDLTAAPYGGDTSPRGVGSVGGIDDQYMAGDSLLVAPLFAGQESRRVYLPPGGWYAFGTARRHEGGQTIEVTPGLGAIPVFVREGAIIPLMEARSHAPAPREAVAIEAQHYGAAPGIFALFDDDGETLAFERGAYRWRTLSVTMSPDGAPAGEISAVDPAWPTTYGPVTWRFFR